MMVDDVVDAFGKAIVADLANSVLGSSQERQRGGSPAMIVAATMSGLPSVVARRSAIATAHFATATDGAQRRAFGFHQRIGQ
jgi:hypothetical protein